MSARRAHLALGSNLGDRLANLRSAVAGLRSAASVDVVALSAVYETEPVGGPDQGAFLNAVVAVDTTLAPLDLLRLCQSLEQDAQRVRQERWGPRTLDVDVLTIEGVTLATEELTVPHPRLHERGFVLSPLADVDPATPRRDWPGVTRTGLTLA